MTAFLLLLNLEQLQIVQDTYPDLLDNTQIVSLDLDVSARLWSLGHSPLSIADLLTMDAIRAIHSAGLALMQSWFASYEDAFRLDGVSPLQLEKRVLAYFFPQALLAYRLLDRLCETGSVTRLYFFESRKRPIHAANYSPDSYSAVWQHIAEARSIPFTLLASGQQTTSRAPRPGKLSRGWRILKFTLSNPLLWQVLARHPRKTVFMTCLINEAVRYSELAAQLTERFGANAALSVCGGRSSGGVTVGNNLYFSSMSLFVGPGYLRLLRLGRAWRKRWNQYRTAHTGPEEAAIFQNPHLDYQFDYVFHESIPNVLHTFFEARRIFRALQTRSLITSSVPTLYLSGVIEAARTLGIPVITFPHSGIVSHTEYQIAGDHTICWTTDAAQAWRQHAGVNPVTVGLPETIVTHGYAQERRTTPHMAGRKRITLLLATVQNGGVPQIDLNGHVAALRTILAVPPAQREHVQITLKLHPVHDYQYLYQYIVDNSPVPDSIEIIRSRALEDVLEETDLAVTVNVPTSAYLLPLAMGIPELYVYTAPYVAQTIRFAEWGGCAVIRQQEEIWPAMEAALFDEQQRAALLQDNRSYWDRLNGGGSDAPFTAIVNLLEKLTS